MTDRDRLIDEPNYCDYCCNFDKEHVGMDGTSICKLTNKLVWCEDGEDCMFFNLSKERIIVPPCKVGDTVYVDSDTWCYVPIRYENVFIHSKHFLVGEIVSIIKTKKQLLMKIKVDNSIHTRYSHKRYTVNAIGVTVFLTKEEAERALKEREQV